MDIMSETIQREFYNGFIEALVWSTSAGPDYSEAPGGYRILGDDRGSGFNWFKGDEQPENWADIAAFDTEREAIAAAWEDSGEAPPELESMEDFKLSDDADVILRAICLTFCRLNRTLLHQYAREMDGKTSGCGTVWEHAGHDFWMTLAGHGVGFWDRGLGTLGDDLTSACEPFEHKIEPYIGDDGLIHV